MAINVYDSITIAEDIENYLDELFFDVYDYIDFGNIDFGSSCINHWKMNDDISNTDVLDSVGTNHGTLNENTENISIDGITSKAFKMNGTSNIISLDATDFPWNSEMSFSCWFKFDGVSGRRETIFYYGNGWYADDMFLLYRTSSDVLNFTLMKDGATTTIFNLATITDTDWHHIVISKGDTCTAWLDGVQAGYDSSSLYMSNIGIGMYFSRASWGGERIGGEIDNFILFNRELIEEEVLFLYNDGVGTENLTSGEYLENYLDELFFDVYDEISILEDIDLFDEFNFDIYDSISLVEDVDLFDELSIKLCFFDNFATLGGEWTTADLDGTAGTSFTVSGNELIIDAAGSDVWVSVDYYGAVYLSDIAGDFDASVKVTYQEKANAWTKSGIMVKNDIGVAHSPTGYCIIALTPSNGVSFQRDENNNGYLETHDATYAGETAPIFLRLKKEGNIFSAYKSLDRKSWTQIGAGWTCTSANNLQDVGLFQCSHSNGILEEAKFTDFYIEYNVGEEVGISEDIDLFDKFDLEIYESISASEWIYDYLNELNIDATDYITLLPGIRWYGDAADRYITIDNDDAIFNTVPLSFYCDFALKSEGTTQRIFSCHSSSSPYNQWIMQITAGKLQVMVRNTSGSYFRIWANDDFEYNKRYRVLFTVDSSGLAKLYIENVLQTDTDNITDICTITNSQIKIASATGSICIDGDIYDAKFWKKEVSEEERTDIFAGKDMMYYVIDEAGEYLIDEAGAYLIALLELEASWNFKKGEGNTLEDLTGNEHEGTKKSGTDWIIGEWVDLFDEFSLDIYDSVSISEWVSLLDLIIELGIVYEEIGIEEYVSINDLIIELGVIYEEIGIEEYVDIFDVIEFSVLEYIGVLEYNINELIEWYEWAYIFDVEPRLRIFEADFEKDFREEIFDVIPRLRIFDADIKQDFREEIFEVEARKRIFDVYKPKLKE